MKIETNNLAFGNYKSYCLCKWLWMTGSWSVWDICLKDKCLAKCAFLRKFIKIWLRNVLGLTCSKKYVLWWLCSNCITFSYVENLLCNELGMWNIKRVFFKYKDKEDRKRCWRYVCVFFFFAGPRIEF